MPQGSRQQVQHFRAYLEVSVLKCIYDSVLMEVGSEGTRVLRFAC